jgi:hypothetical protein
MGLWLKLIANGLIAEKLTEVFWLRLCRAMSGTW